MKQFTLILLVLSLLTGCSAHKELPEAPPDEKEAAQVPSDLEAPDSSLTPQFTLPVTEEALRTYYQAEEIDVQEILPCEGDFLVYGRTKAGGGVFHWVYGQTGVALPLFSSGEQVFSWEVLSQGQIRVVHGGENAINAALSFPSVTEASAVVRLDESGRPAPAGSQWGDETTSAYVAPSRKPTHLAGTTAQQLWWMYGSDSAVQRFPLAPPRTIRAAFSPPPAPFR